MPRGRLPERLATASALLQVGVFGSFLTLYAFFILACAAAGTGDGDKSACPPGAPLAILGLVALLAALPGAGVALARNARGRPAWQVSANALCLVGAASILAWSLLTRNPVDVATVAVVFAAALALAVAGLVAAARGKRSGLGPTTQD